jgi:single-strand DNA-binding protein
MAGLNKVMIIGNLGADPEMRYMADGTALTNLRVAATRNYSTREGERKEETEWFSVSAWGKLAEQCSQFLQKGRRVYVEGRLRTRSWDTPEGEKRYRTEVVAEQVLFIDRAGGSGEFPDRDRAGAAPYGNNQGMGELEPEDIPFE